MPTYPIQLKRNGTAAATPSSLLHGEVALNYADGKLFWKDASNVIQSFTFQAYAASSHAHAASDITSGTLDAARIANDSITYAKIQNVSATDRLLGRSSAGSGDVEEITCTAFGRSLIDDADAATARTTLSVQPTASPAFTGTVTAAAVTLSGQLLVTAGSVSACGVAFSGDPNTGLAQIGGADTASLVTAGVERVRVGANGRSQFFAANEKFGVQLNKSSTANGPFLGSDGADIFTVSTSGGGEMLRVDATGNVCVNPTGDTNPAGSNVAGACLSPNGYLSVTRNSDNPLLINRKTLDGTLTTYQQDGTTEGSISVSGNTVSYNAFCGSHWAQLIDGSRPAILRGTVLETIDEMCEWPGEPRNDRLPRVRVSDTPRSRRVYGVFMAWDDDDAATGDMYATAVGAYMVRVSGTVHPGDLLESAGDGTACTQSDDIVRSSTIGKVSSTHRVAEYDDGSYLLPCVLMCG